MAVGVASIGTHALCLNGWLLNVVKLPSVPAMSRCQSERVSCVMNPGQHCDQGVSKRGSADVFEIVCTCRIAASR